MQRSATLQAPVNSSTSTNVSSRYEIVEPRASHSAVVGNLTSIGEGAYGVVYKARDTVTGRFVALKKIKLENEADGISSSTLREITLLMQLNHENIVKLENVIFERERMCLIFELLEVDLRRYLDQMQGLMEEEEVRSFSAQLFSGLAHCHTMGIMHRDLKPHNILVSDRRQLKIADFGLARGFTPFARPLTMEVITRWYRAPEIVLGQSRYNCNVDVWSVGCIIAEMSNKRPLFTGECDIDQLFRIFRVLGTPTNDTWRDVEDLPNYQPLFPKWPAQKLELLVPQMSPEGIDLLDRIFVYDPQNRISAKSALNHSYLRPYVADKDLVDPLFPLLQTPVPQHRSVVANTHSSLSNSSASSSASALTSSVSHLEGAASAAVVLMNKVTPDNNNTAANENQGTDRGVTVTTHEASSHAQPSMARPANYDGNLFAPIATAESHPAAVTVPIVATGIRPVEGSDHLGRPTVEESVAPVEVATTSAAPVATRLNRGRKAVEAAVPEKKPVVEAVEAAPADATAPTRGRKRKALEAVAVADEALKETPAMPVASTDAAVAAAEPAVVPPVRGSGKRRRSGRLAPAEEAQLPAITLPVDDFVEDTVDSSAAMNAQDNHGRSGAVDDDEENVVTVVESAAAAGRPTRRSRRGEIHVNEQEEVKPTAGTEVVTLRRSSRRGNA